MSDNQLKILSIENDEFMKIFLKDIFWIHGANKEDLNIFGNLKKAREFLKNPENKPDIILMGIGLPEEDGEKIDVKNGFRFLEDLKSNPETKDIKVIIFSNFGDKEIKEKALKMGVCKFLVKGEYLPQDILKIIRESC